MALDRNKYLDVIQEHCRRFVTFLPVHRYMTGSLTSGMMLSHLTAMFRYFNSNKIHQSDEQIRSTTALTIQELRGAKNRLRGLPFLKVTRKGAPPKTYYRIDWEAYSEAVVKHMAEVYCEVPEPSENPKNELDVWNQQIQTCGFNRFYSNKSNNKNNIQTPRGFTDGDQVNEKTSPVDELDETWIALTSKLLRTVQKIKKMNTCTNKAMWRRSFRLLHVKDQVEVSRIRHVLKWYCEALQDKQAYLPEAYSAITFREKFIRIEAAMERQAPAKPPAAPTLSEKERKWESGMLESLEPLGHRLSGLPELIKALYSFRKRIKEFLDTESQDPEGVKAEYMRIFCHSHLLFYQYAGWINSESRGWWHGDLKCFMPGGRMIAKFIKMVLHNQGWRPGKHFCQVLGI